MNITKPLVCAIITPIIPRIEQLLLQAKANSALPAGSHDLLRVEIDKQAQEEDQSLGPTAMIPFVKEIVPIVDRKSRRLDISPPEGLLSIQAMLKNNSTQKKKGNKRGKSKASPSLLEPVAEP